MSTITPLPGLRPHVELWVDQGLIDQGSAARILSAEEALAPAEPAGRPLVLEALGYVGGVLVALGAVLLTAQLWDDLSTGFRLVVVGACVLVLLGTAAAVPVERGRAGRRLRAVLLVLATAAASLWTSLLAVEALDLDGLDVGVVTTGVTAALALALWYLSPHALQHAAAFVALTALVGTAIADVAPDGSTGDALPGLGMLALGAAWLGLALGRRLPPYPLAVVLGGVGVVVGGTALVSVSWGRFVAVAAVAALLVVGVVVDELRLLAVGTVGLLVVLPRVLMTWFPGAVAAPLVLFLGGGCVVALALRFLRRSADAGHHTPAA